MGQVTARHRAQVEARDGGCVAHGQLPGRCWGHLDIGHLIGRGMGGSDLYDTPGWLTLQCRHHNGLIEDDAAAAREATRLGFKMPRRPADLMPARALVRYPDGHWYYLNHDDPATKERMHDHGEPQWRNRIQGHDGAADPGAATTLQPVRLRPRGGSTPLP